MTTTKYHKFIMKVIDLKDELFDCDSREYLKITNWIDNLIAFQMRNLFFKELDKNHGSK